MASYKVSIYPHKVAAIKFGGAVDTALIRKAAAECTTRECYAIAIDLSDIAHLSNSTVPPLIEFKQQLENKGGRLVFVDISYSVRIMFEMVGLLELVTIYDDLNTALQDLVDGWTNTKRISL